MGSNPSYFDSSERNPVEMVSWEDCQEFIKKLNSLGVAPADFKFRLPTEAEWEYACRAGTTTAYFWGASLNGNKANCNGNYPYGAFGKGKNLEHTTEVGSYKANPWGLYDMHGNVWEWCEDKYVYYGYGDLNGVQNPVYIAPEGYLRVLRGGSWDSNAEFCRSANRNGGPTSRRNCVGFRLALRREF